MKCTVCGNDTLIKYGDWYRCLNCGAEFFDRSIGDGTSPSPTMEIERLEGKHSPIDFSTGEPTSPAPEKSVEKKQEARETVRKEVTSTRKQGGRKKKEKPPKSRLREAMDFLTPILIAFVLAVFLKNFVFANATVPTGSMLNTIQKGDHIIASRLSYVIDEPKRYDVVIFEYPDWEVDPEFDEKTYFVKRIIGLPGETVEIRYGNVYVTTETGMEMRIRDDFVNGIPRGSYGPYVVPEGCYFMLGDNRNNSKDSRFWENKYVSEDKILGKVKFRYYPSIGKIE